MKPSHANAAYLNGSGAYGIRDCYVVGLGLLWRSAFTGAAWALVGLVSDKMRVADRKYIPEPSNSSLSPASANDIPLGIEQCSSCAT
jgi:hypothetical protein